MGSALASIATAARPAPARLLVAEDDAAMRHLLAWALRQDGHTVVEASNGIDLLDRVATSARAGLPVDIVITDIRMPGITGLEALDWLAELGDAVPAIVITAFGDRETHAAAERLGAWAVLDKPFDFEALRALVAELRDRQRRDPEA